MATDGRLPASYWTEWHQRYEHPRSSMPRRLLAVQGRIREVFDHAPPGPIRVLSICSGQSRDLAGVLEDHPRRQDVEGRVVDLDDPCTRYARNRFRKLGLSRIVAVTGDASNSSAFEGAVPADLVLVCGLFGNIVDADVKHTIEVLPELCTPSAQVIWTRHRNPPDLTPAIRAWFIEVGFEDVAFDSAEDAVFGVGVARLSRAPRPFVAGRHLFTFLGEGTGTLTTC